MLRQLARACRRAVPRASAASHSRALTAASIPATDEFDYDRTERDRATSVDVAWRESPCAHAHELLPIARPVDPERKLCSLGTGERVHILSYEAKEPAAVPEFERIVQGIAFNLHEMEAGISDVRVCHPRCGEATFIVTVVSTHESQRFAREIVPQIEQALQRLGSRRLSQTGSLMPQAHSLSSLITQLAKTVRGSSHAEHDIAGVRHEIGKWFPRREEYARYVHWDQDAPGKYTRNLVFSSEEMEVLLMCWPAGSRSAIHCHDDSSCWVAAVEGQVVEVQFQTPKTDRKFFQDSMTNPNGAIGRCGPLKVSNVTVLGMPDSPMDTYANNDIGIHRIENRTDAPAITLHVYAPRLRKMTIFKQAGDHSIASVAAVSYMSEGGELTGLWGRNTDPDGVIDVDAWNRVAAE
jgi:cysteine dioxygenase